jgi:hypothetical protein
MVLCLAQEDQPLSLTLNADDRFGVYDLYARYSWALDTVDEEAYMGVFAPTGRYNTFQGEALRENFRRLVGTDHWAGSQHYNGQILFLEGDGSRCKVKCYSTISFRRRDGSAGIRHLGFYRDTCVKIDGVWLFEDRQWAAWDADKVQEFGRITSW